MATNTKRKPAVKKAAPAPTGNTPAVASAPQAANAPLFKCTAQTWPQTAQGGVSIRAYAYKVAMQLTALHKKGFTVAQYKAALAAGKVGANKPITGYKQPSAGWASHNMHTYTTNPKQAWCVPA